MFAFAGLCQIEGAGLKDAAALTGLALELALLRAAEVPRLVRIEQLGHLGQSGQSAAAPPGPLPAAAGSTPGPAATSPGPDAASGAIVPSAAPDAADEIRRFLVANPPSLAGLLDFHKAHFAVQGSTLILEAVPALDDALRDEAKAGQLGDAVRSVLGPEADWKTTPAAAQAREGESPPPVGAEATDAQAPTRRTAPGRQAGRSEARRTRSPGAEARTAAEKDQTVRAVLDIFGGRVVDVRPRTQ